MSDCASSQHNELPELTLKAIILGIILAIIISSTNAYLGLFAGQTISASIPAAVISMAILRFFKTSNVLESNIVQTAASAGGSIVGGSIFTMPGLIIMGYWHEFHYWWVVVLAGMGGILGVLFSVPLRRFLVIEQNLPYPEGTATAAVLSSVGTEYAQKSVRTLLFAAAMSAVVKFCQAGFRLWDSVACYAGRIGSGVFYFGADVSPALLAVGYIVGLNVGTIIFVSGGLSWLVVVPLLNTLYGNDPAVLALGPHATAMTIAFTIWSNKIRYIGVGAMLVGALWSMLSLVPSLLAAIGRALQTHRNFKLSNTKRHQMPRIEQDIPMKWVLITMVVVTVPLACVGYQIFHSVLIAGVMTVIMFVAGFLFSAVAGYMAGIVGSSNNPISGVTICTTLFSSFVLLFLLRTHQEQLFAPVAAIMISAVVCCAASTGSDTLQDIKAGTLLGATPWKQQLAMLLGTVFSVLFVAPMLNLLLQAYGMGVPNALHPDALPAPQAMLMMSVAVGVFDHQLPWDMIMVGVVVGTIIAILDYWAKRQKWAWHFPVLAVAIGIYLPIELTTPVFLGALVSHFVNRRYQRSGTSAVRDNRSGILFAAGLITGEAILGIMMAVPIVMTGNVNVFALMAHSPFGGWPGLFCLCVVAFFLSRAALETDQTASRQTTSHGRKGL